MKKSEKTVDDEGTTPQEACDIGPFQQPGNRPRCLFCGFWGIVVAQFPRRGYGGKVFPEEMGLVGEGSF